MSTRKPHARLGRVTATAIAVAVTLVACGNNDGTATPITTARTSEPAAPTDPPADTTSPPAVTTTATEPPTSPPQTTPPQTAAASTPPTTVTSTPPTAQALELPTARSEIVPTAGDLPNGVYRFTQTVDDLLAADPDGSYSTDDEMIGEFVLDQGRSEIRYFNIDGTPMQGEPPDTGGVYQVDGDIVIFATPPERSLPGTNGILLLRWWLDGDTLRFEQIDGNKVDADFTVPWTRVGDAP